MENWIEIDLNRLKNNYIYIKSKTQSPLCAVIKADGYGIGSYEIARELENLGVNIFAVAFFKEAMELRNFGIKSEILILNYILPEKLREIQDDRLILTLYSMEQLKVYLDSINLEDKRFHIKINSGMNRLGFNKVDIKKLVKLIKINKLNIEGVYSHFAHVEDEHFTRKQYELFLEASKELEEGLDKKLVKHISNSGATLKYNGYGLDFVRVGMGLYGMQALECFDSNIKGIITWKSRISSIRNVKKHERIAYGKELVEADKKIAIIPVGYSHGYIRQLNSSAFVIINGEKAKIIGKIFMDQMVIDVTEMKNIAIGDEVILLGDGVEAEVIAKFSETIADDVISKINPRIERVFIKENNTGGE